MKCSEFKDSAVIAVGNVTKSSSSMEDWRSHNDTLSRSILTMASWLEHEPSLAGVALARSARVFWHMVGAEQSALPPTGIAGEAFIVFNVTLNFSTSSRPGNVYLQ
ncbi:hypothetical protein AB6A40_011024 [Gnathostoma spinigerum]|uniref:Uncharacterized protein n=1 Tax=Gnathostoma spinigerum TaxID=75299 RepID=A0ABD6F475_9BILA